MFFDVTGDRTVWLEHPHMPKSSRRSGAHAISVFFLAHFQVALDVSSVSVDGSSPLPKNGDQPTMIPDEMDTPAVEAMDISSEVGTEAVAAEEGYPTDEQLLKAIREAIAGAAHISSLTVKKVRKYIGRSEKMSRYHETSSI